MGRSRAGWTPDHTPETVALGASIIRQPSRLKFGRDRVTVEAELSARLAGPDKPACMAQLVVR